MLKCKITYFTIYSTILSLMYFKYLFGCFEMSFSVLCLLIVVVRKLLCERQFLNDISFHYT